MNFAESVLLAQSSSVASLSSDSETSLSSDSEASLSNDSLGDFEPRQQKKKQNKNLPPMKSLKIRPTSTDDAKSSSSSSDDMIVPKRQRKRNKLPSKIFVSNNMDDAQSSAASLSSDSEASLSSDRDGEMKSPARQKTKEGEYIQHLDWKREPLEKIVSAKKEYVQFVQWYRERENQEYIQLLDWKREPLDTIASANKKEHVQFVQWYRERENHQALPAAVLQSPSEVNRYTSANNDDSTSVSSSSHIDNSLPGIFSGVPGIFTPIDPAISQKRVSFADMPPPNATATGRHHWEDETKHQLTQDNISLRQQMDELKQENERLQRQIAVQNNEHRYDKAVLNDRVLDLQFELDATKLKQKRIKEAQEDAILERELDNLRSQLDDNDHGSSSSRDGGDEEVTKHQSQANPTHHVTATTSQDHHFAIIPPRVPPNDSSKADEKAENQALQRTIQELTSEQFLWKQEKQQLEAEKSQLHALIQKMTDQVDDSRIRAEWLQRELIAICPSDTDSSKEEEKKTEHTKMEDDGDANNKRNDSDGYSSDMSAASTKKTGRPISETKSQASRGSIGSSSKASLYGEDPPKRVLERRLREALESYVQIQGHQDRKIKELTKTLNSLEKEKEMDEGLQYQQTVELKQKVSYYQHQLQQTQKTLQFQEKSRDEFHNDWTRRIEELELENLKLAQQASKWEDQCVHQTGLLKRQLSSLQDKLDQSASQVEELVQQERGEELGADSSKSSGSASSGNRNAEVDAMALQLTQSKEREATLEKQLSDQAEKLKIKEEELERARERISVLKAFAGMEESSGETPSSKAS